MINVTKSFLPPLEDYVKYLEGIWQRGHLTNHGPLVNELEEKLKSYFGVKHFFYVNNGTIALQLAMKALSLSGEVITTPFSYVATSSSLVWENLKPVFVDIDPVAFTIDAGCIESKITHATSAVLATHVYGIPCQVDSIEAIAKKHDLKIIYDAAHAFGVQHKGRSIVNYGDISTLSFHATKLFHTVEGGGIATNDDTLAHRLSYMRNFGHNGQEDFWGLGINGKSSEFHAAMGLCVYPHMNAILEARRKWSDTYTYYFREYLINLQRPKIPEETIYNYAYYPVIFDNEKQLLAIKYKLNTAGIYPRRYFYPSLNNLPYFEPRQSMPIAESISVRVLCLPLYYDMSAADIKNICQIIAGELK